MKDESENKEISKLNEMASDIVKANVAISIITTILTILAIGILWISIDLHDHRSNLQAEYFEKRMEKNFKNLKWEIENLEKRLQNDIEYLKTDLLIENLQ